MADALPDRVILSPFAPPPRVTRPAPFAPWWARAALGAGAVSVAIHAAALLSGPWECLAAAAGGLGVAAAIEVARPRVRPVALLVLGFVCTLAVAAFLGGGALSGLITSALCGGVHALSTLFPRPPTNRKSWYVADYIFALVAGGFLSVLAFLILMIPTAIVDLVLARPGMRIPAGVEPEVAGTLFGAPFVLAVGFASTITFGWIYRSTDAPSAPTRA